MRNAIDSSLSALAYPSTRMHPTSASCSMESPASVRMFRLCCLRATFRHRTTGLRRCGLAWDVLRLPEDARDLALELQIIAQAKRNIDLVVSDTPADARSRLHSRPGLAQRAREMGALLARKYEALAGGADPRAEAPGLGRHAGGGRLSVGDQADHSLAP